MIPVVVYKNYFLYEWGKGWKSLINDEWLFFDTAGQWKEYIDLMK